MKFLLGGVPCGQFHFPMFHRMTDERLGAAARWLNALGFPEKKEEDFIRYFSGGCVYAGQGWRGKMLLVLRRAAKKGRPHVMTELRQLASLSRWRALGGSLDRRQRNLGGSRWPAIGDRSVG